MVAGGGSKDEMPLPTGPTSSTIRFDQARPLGRNLFGLKSFVRISCFVSLVVGLLLVLRGVAQQPGTFDTNYVTVPGTDQLPAMITPYPGGKLLAAGGFTNYGGTGRAGVVRLTADGTVDSGFTLPQPLKIDPPIVFNGQVFFVGATNPGNLLAALALPDGRSVVAGTFTHLGGVAVKEFAVLAADGTPQPVAALPDTFAPGALLSGPGDTFYVGGGGTFTGGLAPLVRLHPDGTRDSGFTPPTLTNLSILSANLGTLMPGPGDTVYAVLTSAINFSTARYELVRFTASGALDVSFNGTGRAQLSFPTLFQFAVAPGGQIVFYGTGQYRGAELPKKLNRLTLAGDFDATFVAASEPSFGGGAVAVQPDGKVLFTGANGAAITRLNVTGTVDTGYVDPAKFPPGRSAPAFVRLLAAADGSLYSTGFGFVFTPVFQQLNGVFHVLGDPNTAPEIVIQPRAQTNTFGARTRFLVGAQGGSPLAYQWARNGTAIPDATASELVIEPTTAADRDADFTCTVSNGLGSKTTDAVRLTLLEATAGSVYRETDVPLAPDGEVRDLAFDSEGRLLAAGGFVKWNGLQRVRAVRMDAGGRIVDPAFDTGSQLNGVPALNTIYPLSSGKSLVLGNLDVSYGSKIHLGYLRLNANGSVDTTFNPDGTGSLFSSAFATRPAEDADGKVLIYDQGWNNEFVSPYYFRLNEDGTRDTSFALGGASYVPSGGKAMLRLPDGRFLVSADLQPKPPAGPANPNNVLRLNSDGTVDPSFVHNALVPFAAGGISQLLRQPDGRILVAGEFTSGDLANIPLAVMRLEADGRLDRTFNPVPRLSASLAGGAQRIALQADGRILVQTRFNQPGLFRLWPNGVLDPEFVPGIASRRSGSSELSAIAVNAANNVFVGGSFEGFNGFPRTNFVRLNGGPLRAVPAPPTIVSQPTRVVAKAGTEVTLTVEPGGDGPFQYQWRRNQTVGSTNFVDVIGATNASLTFPEVRLTPFQQDSGLYQLAVVNPGGAVFTGYITLLVEPDPIVPGMVDTSLAAPNFLGILSGQPQITAVNPDGSIYGSLGKTIVRLFEDGTRDLRFNPPADLVGANDGIAVVKRQPDGKVLIAGRMKDGCLARLLPDGSYDPDFVRTNSYGGFFQNVPWALGLQSDGKILLAGNFENFAGRSQPGLVRFLPNGQFDETFNANLLADLTNPPRALPGSAIGLHVQLDDGLYITGGFTRVQGVARSGVARLKADGSLDASFVPPAMANVGLGDGGNFTLYAGGPLTPEGGLYVFGRFQFEFNGPIFAALRLRPDGTEDSGFRVSTDFQINGGVVQGDGKLIITGQFTRLNNQARGGFARLNLDGSTDTTFAPTATFGVGAPMTILPDGKLLAASQRYFTGVGPLLAAPEIDFAITPAGLELTWPSGFKLQRTVSLAPLDWQNVANPSPFTVPLGGPGEFFRVVPAP